MNQCENGGNENSVEINSKNSLAFINDQYEKPKASKKRKLNEIEDIRSTSDS